MTHLILDRDDFKNEGALTFDTLLESVGAVDPHGDPLDIDSVGLWVRLDEGHKNDTQHD